MPLLNTQISPSATANYLNQTSQKVNPFSFNPNQKGGLVSSAQFPGLGVRAKSADGNVAKTINTITPANTVKSTGTEAGDIAAGIIKGSASTNVPTNSNTTTNTNASPYQIPQGFVRNSSGQLVPDNSSGNSFGGLVSKLANTAEQGSSGYNQAVQNLATFNQNLAKQYGNIESMPIPLEFQQGREQVLARQAASEEAALQGAVTQQQTQQQQQLGALGTAAGLAQPQLGQYGQAYYNPLTAGSAGGGTGVSPSDPFYATLQQYAQMAANGQYSAIPASVTGNPALSAQLNQMATAINPSYNPVQSSAQSSIQTQQAGTVASYQSALQQARNVGSQLNDLINTFGLNPSDINAANSGLQKIAQNTSNPQYQQLSNYLNSLASLYAQILTPTGGTTTDTTRSIAASMLDATAKGTSIQSTISALDNEAQARIAGVSTTGNQSNSGSSFTGAAWK